MPSRTKAPISSDLPIDYESHPSLHSAETPFCFWLRNGTQRCMNLRTQTHRPWTPTRPVKYQIGESFLRLLCWFQDPWVPPQCHLHIIEHAKPRVGVRIPSHRFRTGFPRSPHGCEVTTKNHFTRRCLFAAPSLYCPRSIPLHQKEGPGAYRTTCPAQATRQQCRIRSLALAF
ncbi:hypothetical protein SODALDRAFT_41740 [Sodiomyces alkalinus F11]|uniref:Uncharacterized protein n=1 Tax=Sodiomyces alkalinus (strain CBS 110278 / VKM F-3762 / F11) TaxID=1314773 RepID=A0A3N2QA06_SODAK|nr:hypothetical protein SODALDRAFT_41740 [Sodiomyces alkalinus F11]ROT43547.1 hypothetical protein SODALDRAFT_41740 [Sodiomyces alkalinus F11]